MKPGGAFEMFEEDLYFPGKSRDADEVEDVADSQGSAPKAFSNGGPKPISQPVSHALESSARPDSPPTPRGTGRRSQESKPVSSADRKDNAAAAAAAPPTPRRNPSPKPLFQPPPLSRSMTAPAASKAHTTLPRLSISTTVSTQSKATVTQMVVEGKIHNPAGGHRRHRHHQHGQATSPTTSISSPTASIPVVDHNLSPSLVRTTPKAPVNPRDHSVLEMIYMEMHAARFINPAPLSLLASLLSTWFKGTWDSRISSCLRIGLLSS